MRLAIAQGARLEYVYPVKVASLVPAMRIGGGRSMSSEHVNAPASASRITPRIAVRIAI
jgi:hypothetical protein